MPKGPLPPCRAVGFACGAARFIEALRRLPIGPMRKTPGVWGQRPHDGPGNGSGPPRGIEDGWSRSTPISPPPVVSGQQSPSRIFAIALVSLAKMSTRFGARYGTYATSVASISTGFASSAPALIQWLGSRFSCSATGGLCMSFSNTHSK